MRRALWRLGRGALVMMALATAGPGCTGPQNTQEKLQAHFAVGKSWPEAIGTLERSVGPARLFQGGCKTDLGGITFNKMPTGEYVLTYPTRGAGAPGAVTTSDPDAFVSGLGDAFVNSRCEHAEIEYEQYAVAVDVQGGSITSVRVARAR